MKIFLRRIAGAMTLDPKTYEDVESDQSAGGQALAVVLLSALAGAAAAHGLGAAVWELPTLVVLSLMVWAAWAVLTFQVGIQLLPTTGTRSDVGELLRTIGFSTAPGLLAAVGIVPSLSKPVVAVTALWMLAAMVVAVRQALDYQSTARAIAVCVIGSVLSLLGMMLFGSILSPVLSRMA